jgi:hypothetical protein
VPQFRLAILASLLAIGCGTGDLNPAAVRRERRGSDAGGPPETVVGEADVSIGYVEPLVRPIDLGGLRGTLSAGGREYVRSLEGENLVDPLDLPEEPGDELLGDEELRPLIAAADFSRDERASFHPHGEEVCASGCAASRHPTPPLDRAEFRRLLREFARGPLGESNPAVESLLFHGRQTSAWIEQLGTDPVNDERARFLRRELKVTHALVSFRIVDEHGVVRTHMPPTRVPFDRRHVFEMETDDLPPLETSGTVKRVGLHHLWTRL